MTFADMGRIEATRVAAQEVLDPSPGFLVKGFVNVALPNKDRAKPERALATLLQIGLPE